MKVSILKTLKDQKGQYVSGEALSNRLGVSRTAIWKHIAALREEGHSIESSSRKGYKLLSSPDIILAEEIQAELATGVFGREMIYMDTVSSTNTVAKEKAAENYPEGTVVIANHQTAGKGRLGRKWESARGTGIWMSVILRPDITPAQAPLITIFAALAVARALEQVTGVRPGVKWPNDIVYHKAKVCGILTEMSAEIEQVNYVVVGIGINVHHNIEDYPAAIRETATSLKAVTGRRFERKTIIKNVLEQFEEVYRGTQDVKKELIEEYKKYSLTLGSMVKVTSRDSIIEGEAVEITDEGELMVRTKDGTTHTIFSGEVSVRGLYGYV